MAKYGFGRWAFAHLFSFFVYAYCVSKDKQACTKRHSVFADVPNS